MQSLPLLRSIVGQLTAHKYWHIDCTWNQSTDSS